MIIHVRYVDRQVEHNEMQMVGQLIDCQRIYPLESKTHWGFMAYDANDILITEHKFAHDENVKAYIMERGKTVDVLPRR